MYEAYSNSNTLNLCVKPNASTMAIFRVELCGEEPLVPLQYVRIPMEGRHVRKLLGIHPA